MVALGQPYSGDCTVPKQHSAVGGIRLLLNVRQCALESGSSTEIGIPRSISMTLGQRRPDIGIRQVLQLQFQADIGVGRPDTEH